MNKFLESIADVLEEPGASLDTRFRETPQWCSLVAFGLLVAMENDWRAPLSVDELAKMHTIRDLYRAAFTAFAARVMGVANETAASATRGSIPQWDSVNHLRLVMEAEELFGVSFPLEKIPQLNSVEDFVRA
ncbi:MAG: acyl carrier protein [Kiritimatiellae bacterium]|nr:acyl carrier protein [Kiritimatiellia bacterium]